MHPSHSLQKHWQKNDVHADERRPEMHLAPELAHPSTSCFREPVIDASEKSEDCARCDDVMEVRDHIVGVVQIEVGAIEGKRDAGKTADSKHRQKRDGEKHRHIEANGAAPK